MKIDHPQPAVRGHLKLLEWTVDAWKAQSNKSDSANYGPAVDVFQLVHDIFRRFKHNMTIQDLGFLQDALLMLGLESAAVQITEEYKVATGYPAALVSDGKMPDSVDRLSLTSAYFQMMHAGCVAQFLARPIP